MYEYFMICKDACEIQGQIYAEAGDTALTQFYMNAAYGFKLKAEALSIRESIETNND